MLLGILINIFFFTVIIAILISNIKKNSISISLIVCILLIKIIAGSVYGIIYSKTDNSDTWLYHAYGLEQYKWLQKDFLAFIKDLFQHGYQQNQASTFFNSENSYWKDLPLNMMIKLLAIFNTVSNGNYYINVFLFNLFGLIGNVYLYKLLVLWFTDKQKIIFWMLCLFPTLIFWTSGIHKDGIIFTIIILTIYSISKLLLKQSSLLLILIAIASFIVLFLFRNFVAATLFIWLPAFVISTIKKKYVIRYYLIAGLFSLLLFVLSTYGSSAFNIPMKIAERQMTFLELKGNSFLPIATLKPEISSYFSLLPTAINHAFLRPYFTEVKNVLSLLSAIENVFVIFILLFSLIFCRNQLKHLHNPLLIFLFCLAFTNYLLIGYTVPFSGAIVRYRVIFELFLLIPALILIDHRFNICTKIASFKLFNNNK